MRLTFRFTDQANIEALPKEDIYDSHFEIPDEAKLLIGCEERIMAIAQYVGQLTHTVLYLTCKELGIKNRLIKANTGAPQWSIASSSRVILIQFRRDQYQHRHHSCQLKIYNPISIELPRHLLLSLHDRRPAAHKLIRIGDGWCQTDEQRVNADTISSLAEQLLMLLNAEPNAGWQCAGFHPHFYDSRVIESNKKRSKKREAAQRKREREEKKRAAQQAKAQLKEGTPPAGTGAGRRGGAVPGIFKGVQMRSQLEIRFASELEKRGIRWIYEYERLGEGNYLVDFYLPDFGCWVEVKGRFEARDEYLLKEVAGFLQMERHQRLFVFTQRQIMLVHSEKFEDFPREQFWALFTP
jgi:hypothetical protein